MTKAAELDKARAGDVRALARLISLVEDESPQVRSVIKDLLPDTGRARIIGLTGSPGVGKSTVTGALLSAFRAAGHRIAVLAVDPSSPFTGGALLGDRIRMQEHATDGHRCSSGRWRAAATWAGWRPRRRRPSGCSTRPGST